MKKILSKISLATFCLLIPTVAIQNLDGAEVDKGLVIIDNKPWKTSWIHEDGKAWVLIAQFDKGVLKTYFKKAPPNQGFGLSADNKPSKQILKFYSGKEFVSTNCQFEQWPDGAKAYAFSYEDNFKRDGEKLMMGTTAIIEEVNGAENEIRYALYR